MVSTQPTCPNCGQAVRDGDIICSTCNTNLLTGQKIEPGKAVTERRLRLRPFAIGGAVVALLVAAAAAVLLLSRPDPVRVARALAAEGKYLEAIDGIEEHLAQAPEDTDALRLLAELHWRTERYALAAGAFETVAEVRPEDTEAALLAVAALTRTGGDSTGTQIEILRRLLENDPDNRQAEYLLALSLGRAGELQQQIAVLNDLTQPADARPQASTMLGAALTLMDRRPAAAEAFATARRRGDAGAMVTMAEAALASLNGDAEATLLWQRAVDGFPAPDAIAQARLGLAYMAQGEFAQALPLLTAANEDPEAPGVVPFFYALCLQALNQEGEALVAYDRLSKEGGPYAARAQVQLALLYANQGELDRAQNAIRSALADGGSSPRLFTVQGQLLARQGDYPAATRSFENALQLNPDYAPAHLERGLVYIQTDALSDGLRSLERYLQDARDTADPDAIREVELLVEQLRQATNSSGAPRLAAARDDDGEGR